MRKSLFSSSSWLSIAAALIALLMLCAAISGCTDKKPEDSVIEYESYGISREFYELMLSRWKGDLAREGHDVEPASDFWSIKLKDEQGKEISMEQTYNKAVLDICKNYLAAVVLFDREGLKLSDGTIAEIDDEIAFFIDYHGQGSRDKLDAILSKYGTDTDGLREIYIIEAKYRAVINYYYGGGISDTVSQEYYEQNYYRFKQIFVSNFYYKYQTDGQGNVIYFDPETSKPIYDTENGRVIYDEGWSRKDEFGQEIYFDEQGKILYNTEKGLPTPELDDKGEAVRYEYTDSEMAERIEKMQELQGELKAGNFAAFEAEMPAWALYEGTDDYYPDGYYLSRIESKKYPEYLMSILMKLENMEVGEIRTVESDDGYHIIMKYELDDGKFKNAEYAEWFDAFSESLRNKLFLDKCKSFYADIKTVAENISKARSIKQVGVNYNY